MGKTINELDPAGAISLTDLLEVWQGADPSKKASLTNLLAAIAGLVLTQLNADNLRLDGNTLSATNANGSVNLDFAGTGGVKVPVGSAFDHIILRVGGDTTGFANESGTIMRIFVGGAEYVRLLSSNFRVVAGGNTNAPDIVSASNGGYALVPFQPDSSDDDTGVAHGSNADEVVLAAGGATTVMGKFASGAARVGFLGATPAVQQTGGAATAGVAYTATEQAMLQAAYDCLRTFGLLS